MRNHIIILALVILTPLSAAEVNLLQPINNSEYTSNKIDFWVSSQEIESGSVELIIDGRNVYEERFENGNVISGETVELSNGNHRWRVKLKTESGTHESATNNLSIVKPKPRLEINLNDSETMNGSHRINYNVEWSENGTVYIKSGENNILETRHEVTSQSDLSEGNISVNSADSNYKLVLDSGGIRYSKNITSKELKVSNHNFVMAHKKYFIIAIIILIITTLLIFYRIKDRNLNDNKHIQEIKNQLQ